MLIKKNIEEVYADDSKITEELVNRYHKMALRVGNRKAFIEIYKIYCILKLIKRTTKANQSANQK